MLKVIFEVNLKLFEQDNNNKKLVFLLRDYDDRTNFDVVKDMLHKDILKIWGEIYKPDKFKESKPEDFFYFEYHALPHKIFQEEKF